MVGVSGTDARASSYTTQWIEVDNISTVFGSLLEDRNFADVTLVTEDSQKIEAHKVILAA